MSQTEKELPQFKRHKSLFKQIDEGLLLWLWHTNDGEVYQLIVVGKKKFDHLVEKTHKHQSSPHQQAGIRRTFAALPRNSYTYNMR